MGIFLDCVKGKNYDDSFDNIILKSKIARDKVKNYLKRIEKNKNNQRELSKEQIKKGNREKAKFYLASSKAFEKQIEVGYGQLSMLENQIMMIEKSKQELSAIGVLEEGNMLLKKLQKEISIEKWEKVEEDMDLAREKKNELDKFFRDNGLNSEEIDNELNIELEKLNLVSDLPDISNKAKKDLKKENDQNKSKRLLIDN